MPSHFAPTALLPDGWAEDVRIDVSEHGDIVAVTPGSPPGAAERLAGPVLPGMPNLHSHAFQRAMAGLAERAADPGAPGDDFWSWRETMYRFLGRLGPEEVEAIASQLYLEMLRHGYTAVGEFHYLHHSTDGSAYADPAELSHRVVSAARGVGIGITHLPVFYARGGFGGAPPTEGQRRFVHQVEGVLQLFERLRSTCRDDPQVRIGIAPHSLRAVTPETLSEVVAGARADDSGTPIHIHVAEQAKEVEMCLAWSGARPVEWLLRHAPVDEHWCLVHATHLTAEEAAGIAASGAVAGLCPTTEANLGDGIFPLRSFLEVRGRWGIGSDSNVCVSPTEELRLLEYGQRLLHRQRIVARTPGATSVGRALYAAALEGGARALGRRIGRIAPGCRADLVVLDPEHPSLAEKTGDALLDSLVFAPGGAPVRDVLVGRRWVIREGHHPEEAEILERYRRALRRVALA